MNDVRRDQFDEALLSGYLDKELTQADNQRVRLYLEDHPSARQTLEEMREMREAALTTRFAVPDRSWDESPATSASRLARGLGWTLTGVWCAGMGLFALWSFFTAPESLWTKSLIAGPILGIVLLFVSVLMDRIREAKTDRYRRVEK